MMYHTDSDFELELNPGLFNDEFDAPEAPENWELEDFDDLLSSDTWH